MLVRVGAADDRGTSATVARHREHVRQALGLNVGSQAARSNAGANYLNVSSSGRCAGTADNEVGKVNAKLECKRFNDQQKMRPTYILNIEETNNPVQ